MRIALDISGIYSVSSGMTTYICQLLKHLARIDHENEYLLYTHYWGERDAGRIDEFLRSATNFSSVHLRLPNRITGIVEEGAGIPLQEYLLGRHAVDLFHGLGNVLPVLKKTRSVVTNHGFLKPENFGQLAFEKQTASKSYIKESYRALCCANHVITVSDWSKREMIETLRMDEKKVSTVYLGVEECPATIGVNGILEKKYGITDRYLLAVGPLNVKRNFLAIIEVFGALAQKGEDNGAILVVAGGKVIADADYFSKIMEKIRALGIERKVLLLDNVPFADMKMLYAAAELLLYPSFLEGFGLPLLEAMACGCPVVASNATALPEVCADAALLVDPFKPEEMLRGVKILLEDTVARCRYVQKGYERAKQFTWERTARQTLAVYRTVMSQGDENNA